MRILDLLNERMGYTDLNQYKNRDDFLVGFEFEFIFKYKDSDLVIDPQPVLDSTASNLRKVFQKARDFNKPVTNKQWNVIKESLTEDDINTFLISYMSSSDKVSVVIQKKDIPGKIASLPIADKLKIVKRSLQKLNNLRQTIIPKGMIIALCKSKFIEPIYGWIEENHLVATDWQMPTDFFNTEITNLISSLPQGSKKWIITDDESIEYRGDHIPVELISPPLPLSVAFDAFDKVITWMVKHNCETNDSTGFHINVSKIGMKKTDVDIIKLWLLLGDEYLLKIYNRLNNDFAKPIQKKLENQENEWEDTNHLVRKLNANYHFSGLGKDNIQKTVKILMKAINSFDEPKYSSINFSKLSERKPYIEFRIAGGQDYHRKNNDIKNTILRYIKVLDAASNPELDKNDYYKKLAKLINWILFRNQDNGKSLSSSSEAKLAIKIIKKLKIYQKTENRNMLRNVAALLDSGQRSTRTKKPEIQDWIIFNKIMRHLFKKQNLTSIPQTDLAYRLYKYSTTFSQTKLEKTIAWWYK